MKAAINSASANVIYYNEEYFATFVLSKHYAVKSEFLFVPQILIFGTH